MISAVVIYEDNKVTIHSATAKDVSNKFPSGFYQATTTDGGILITKENLVEIHKPWKSKDINLIINTVESFFKDEIREKVESLGFIHKLGVLLHGKQGCGKTSIINFLAKKLQEERNAIVFFCNSGSTLGGAISIAKSIREVQNNPIVFIADEFERYSRDAESEMKNFLDGKDSISNTLFLGATNYLDRVPDTLKNRPSRFRIVSEIKGIEDKQIMKDILKFISDKISPCLFTTKEINDTVKQITCTTIDELKHICLDKVTSTFVKIKSERNKIGFLIDEEIENKKEDGLYWAISSKSINFSSKDSNV